MATTDIAQREKREVLRLVEKNIGPTKKVGGGQEFTRCTTSGKSWFHVLFSGVSPLPWYGIRPDHLDQASRYKTSHFLFVVKSASQVLVVPAHLIRSIIKKYAIEPKGSNEYHFHIQGEVGAYHFLEAKKRNLSVYCNNYKGMLAEKAPITARKVALSGFVFSPGHNTRKRAARATHQQQSSEIDLVHNRIQTGLYRDLCTKYGTENVGTEQTIGHGAHVDVIVCDRDKKYVFYEIKTSRPVLLCIREALGQLVEYAYYPQADNAKKLIIVSQNPVDPKTRSYLQHIRARFNLPLFCQRYDLGKGALVGDEY